MRTITLEQACNQYPHRYTLQYLPCWARKPHYSETTKEFIGYYMPQYASDAEWYDNTMFPGEGGIRKNEKHCESNNQTWPLGKGFSRLPCMKGQI